MDRAHARAVVVAELAAYRGKSYTELAGAIGEVSAYEVANPDGQPYQVEVQVTWDARPGGDIRVMGAIDDGGWSAFRPLTEDFLVTPEDTVLG